MEVLWVIQNSKRGNHRWSSPTYVTVTYALQLYEHPSLLLPDLTTLQKDIIPGVPITDIYVENISTRDLKGARLPPHI